MARKKVQLAWIENQTARKATFRKRRENLLKKVREISILAGTDACGIILSPFEGDPPLFYPPSITEILNRYLSLPEIDQFKRMVTVESYMNDEINKMKAMLQKERRNVREMEVSYTMNSIHVHCSRSIESLSCDETSELFWYFEELKKKCELMINSFGNNSSNNVTNNGRTDQLQLQVVAPLSSSMAMVQVPNNENLMNDDNSWLAAANYNMQTNFDFGFDPFYGTNVRGMAGPNLNDAPYDHYVSSLMSSSYNNGGFMSNNGGMVGRCPDQPMVGSHQGFFSNNSGC